MTEQEIKTRIEKKEKDISKIERKIKKWTSGMNEEAQKIVAACELLYDDPAYKQAYQKYTEYKTTHGKDPSVYRQDYEWNKGPEFDEAYRAYRELAEQKATLEKYKAQLNKIETFNKSEKIPAIWEFLQEWRRQAYEYFVDNVKLYTNLRNNYDAKWEAYQGSDEYKRKVELADKYGRGRYGYYHIEKEFEEHYYAPIHRVTRDIYLYNGKWNDEKLNKILDKDVENKYNDFVHRITEKAGDIKDVSGLKIGGDGSLNGVVVGDKAKVKVETILAGGYNQDVIVNVKHGQILHYRVLVNVIK